MILRNLIYILQSEGYDFNRFLKFAYSHPIWWKLEDRQRITWTAKAKLLWLTSLLIFIGIAGVLFFKFGAVGLIGAFVLLSLLPFVIGAALVSIMPLDMALKRKRINAAANIITSSGARVVGITGSYGKTSTKEILATILEQRFNVIKTPENVNTDIGIADFILRIKDEIKKDVIFIVEMGAYGTGEIEEICRMVRPEFSILTGINEAHLERFGSLENIIKGKFELPQNTRELSVLNFDDENIRNNYQQFPIQNPVGVSMSDAKNVWFKENFTGLEFEWQGTRFETALLAEHNIALILLAAKIAVELSMTSEEISAGVKNLKPVAHRLEPLYNANTGITVIDDSYNGNFNGILSGIKLLSRAAGRKIVLTPGLVELGPKSQEMHVKIGEAYADGIDLVLLIKTKAAQFIIEGMKRKNFSNYKTYVTAQEAHADLANVLKRGDTIIFQNDLTDNYL